MTHGARHEHDPIDADGPRADPRRWAPRLARLVEQSHEAYTRLAGLSAQQAGQIEREDSVGLLTTIAARQAVVDEIVRLAEQIELFRPRWDESLAALPPPARDALQRRMAELRALSSAVEERDRRDCATLETRRAALAEGLASLTRTRGAVSAYGSPAAPAGPRFQDREG